MECRECRSFRTGRGFIFRERFRLTVGAGCSTTSGRSAFLPRSSSPEGHPHRFPAPRTVRWKRVPEGSVGGMHFLSRADSRPGRRSRRPAFGSSIPFRLVAGKSSHVYPGKFGAPFRPDGRGGVPSDRGGENGGFECGIGTRRDINGALSCREPTGTSCFFGEGSSFASPHGWKGVRFLYSFRFPFHFNLLIKNCNVSLQLRLR